MDRFLLLAPLLTALLVVGAALCGVGLLVATLLVSCVVTAVYRQALRQGGPHWPAQRRHPL